MSQSETTKEKIINAAIKIFANKGFWQTKISDIVKEAGVAQGTFYIYFKSKNDCFKLILSMLHNETISILNDKFSQGFILSEIIIVFIKRIYKYKKISKVFLFEAISSGNEFQELYFNFKKNFKNFFKSLISTLSSATTIGCFTTHLNLLFELLNPISSYFVAGKNKLCKIRLFK